jgi:hypothetical protein
MNTLVIAALVIGSFVSSTPANVHAAPVSTAQFGLMPSLNVGWILGNRRRSVEEVDEYYRGFATIVLRRNGAEAERFVDLAWSTADLLRVDLQVGHPVLLHLVLFILLVIIGGGW